MVYILSVVCWIVSLIPAREIHAHGIDVYAYFEGDHLKGEGAYDDGSPAGGADIKVFDAQGKLLAATKTSSNGIFTLKQIPDSRPVKIEINDGGGHRAEFVLEESPTKEATGNIGNPVPEDRIAVDEEALVRLLRRELSPIRAELARLAGKRRIGISEVFGGLGWIVGLIGAAMWYKHAKPESPRSDQ